MIIKEYHKKPASKDKSPTSLINNLLSATPSCRKIINFLIKYSCHYRNIYPSQRFIGEQIDVCRQTANEALKMAEELGFIESTYYHRQTKSYRIAFFFNNPFIRSALLGILPALSLFPIYGSLSYSRKKDDTNINYKNIYINSYSSYTKNSTSDELILKNREILRQEELKRERLTTNVHKFFYDDTYPGDIYEVKNHKREKRVSMASIETKPQPKFPNALLNKAKKLFEQAQKGKVSAFRARRDLAELKKYYPEGIDALSEWMNSAEGLPFRQWITTQESP